MLYYAGTDNDDYDDEYGNDDTVLYYGVEAAYSERRILLRGAVTVGMVEWDWGGNNISISEPLKSSELR